MISAVRDEVKALLKDVDQAHRIDHIDNVLEMSVKFATTLSVHDLTAIKLIALLHDVDDYKLFEAGDFDLPNAWEILNKFDIPDSLKNAVIKAIREIGFSKRLKGIVPSTIDAMIVSDADMCDAMGINGILRVIEYGEFNGRRFFNPSIMPRVNITYDEYVNHPSETDMNCIFEKLLRLKSMMLTAPGKQEADKRHNVMIEFLRAYFRENNFQGWNTFLTKQLMEGDIYGNDNARSY